MGANYNTILVPAVEPKTLLVAISEALHRLNSCIVHQEEPTKYEDGFHNHSGQVIFIGPSTSSRWIPLSSWGNGLKCEFPEWYLKNPLAMNLSSSFGPVIYLFSYDAGLSAGYSIFEGGQQSESWSLTSQLDGPLAHFSSSLPISEKSSMLAGLLGEPAFDYDTFMHSFTSLEVATAALAARFGVAAHLIDPLDIQDGDGALVVEDGKYKQVSLSGWAGVYYEKSPANNVTA